MAHPTNATLPTDLHLAKTEARCCAIASIHVNLELIRIRHLTGLFEPFSIRRDSISRARREFSPHVTWGSREFSPGGDLEKLKSIRRDSISRRREFSPHVTFAPCHVGVARILEIEISGLRFSPGTHIPCDGPRQRSDPVTVRAKCTDGVRAPAGPGPGLRSRPFSSNLGLPA